MTASLKTPSPRPGHEAGGPESGLYFVATLNHALAPLAEKWDHTQVGCTLGDKQIHHLILPPHPKKAKVARSSHRLPEAVLTPSEVARNWERALNQPLMHLHCPQDGTVRSRLGQRARATARAQAFLSQSDSA